MGIEMVTKNTNRNIDREKDFTAKAIMLGIAFDSFIMPKVEKAINNILAVIVSRIHNTPFDLGVLGAKTTHYYSKTKNGCLQIAYSHLGTPKNLKLDGVVAGFDTL